MGLKCNLNGLTYLSSAKNGREAASKHLVAKTSYSPKKLYNFFKMYNDGRKTKHPFFSILDDFCSAILENCRLRVFENEKGEMLAGYTYKLRRNKLEEKSMYIDGLARNMSNGLKDDSKNIMTNVFEDIKKIAIRKNRKELTLFVFTGDKGLREHYAKLGFKLDPKNDIKKAYLMRVRVEKFLNNTYFKLRKYKEALDIDSVLKQNN